MNDTLSNSVAAAFAGCLLCLAGSVHAQDAVPSPESDPPFEGRTDDDAVESEGAVLGTQPIETRSTVVKSELSDPELERTSGLEGDGYGPGYAAPPPIAPEKGSYEEALFAQDVLKVATSVGFAATGVLGILSAINQPTAFGDGRCSDDGVPPDFGEGVGGKWGCQGMNIVHAGLGVGTTLLYTAEQVTGLVIPGDEPDHGGFHEAMTYIHVGGMVLTPALGLLSANPRVFGVDDSPESDWPRIGRTIHMGVALLTAGAYWTTTLIELTADAPNVETATAPSGPRDSWGGL
jgi:hypothetical protein